VGKRSVGIVANNRFFHVGCAQSGLVRHFLTPGHTSHDALLALNQLCYATNQHGSS
jgi:hypothetical protein